MTDKRWGGVRGNLGIVIATLFVAALSVVAWSMPAHGPQVKTPGVQAAVTLDSPSLAALVTRAEISPYANSVYASLASRGIDSASFLPVSSVTSDVISLFQRVSLQPAFAALYASVGSSGFAVGFGNQMSGGISDVYFTFNAVAGGQTTTTSWDGKLASMTLTGPTTVERPTIVNTVFNSHRWAGSSWWGPGTPTLAYSSADEVYPTVSVNNPYGGSVHEVASVWTGLTDSSHDLLQVGYFTDATVGMRYGQTYYELACEPKTSCSVGGGGTFAFGSGQLQHVSFGDTVEQEEAISGLWTVWYMYVYDYTTGAYASTLFDLSHWLSGGFHPGWTQYIVEAYFSNGVVQQIAKFSQVNFCDATFRSTSASWTTYGRGSGNPYQLQQASSNDNTNQGYVNGVCGPGKTYGYPTVSWANSNYNYNFANS